MAKTTEPEPLLPPNVIPGNKKKTKQEDRLPRKGGSYGRERPKADIDKALEEASYCLELVVHRARCVQAGRQDLISFTKLTDLDSTDFDKLVKAAETLAKIQPAVEAAMDRMSGRLDGKSDDELYCILLERARELGVKLGKGRLEETPTTDDR